MWLDNLAFWWTRWRAERALRYDPMLKEFALKALEYRGQGLKLVAEAPGIAILAKQAAQLLRDFDAKNYLTLDMMAFDVYPPKPIRIVLQWADGESPAKRVESLKAENRKLKAEISLLRELEVTCQK